MKPTLLSLLLAFLVFSCAPIKQAQLAKTDVPFLGVLGKNDNSLIHKNFQQIGRPVMSKPIAISVHQVPFTKSSFKTYAMLKGQRGENVNIKYVDSLPNKPQYFRLEIKDKIGLKSILNLAENEEVRSYLIKDDACKIVSDISFYMHEMEAEFASNSKDLFLVSDELGVLHIERINGAKRQSITIPDSEIFAYDLMGFCWADDQYGKPRIELLRANGHCPDGTEKNAQKIDDVKSYLKL